MGREAASQPSTTVCLLTMAGDLGLLVHGERSDERGEALGFGRADVVRRRPSTLDVNLDPSVITRVSEAP